MNEQYSSPDKLAERLDRALPVGKGSLPPTTSDPLVNTAAAIARLNLPTLSPAASRRIEEHMMAVFNEQYGRQSPTRRQRTIAGAARWALVASLILVLLIASLTPAVAASVPGEPLYPVKQLYERVELAAATSPAAKAAVHVRRADRRTQEALALLARHRFDPSLIDAALAEIDAAATTAAEVRTSPLLRGQLLQAQTLMSFVLEGAQQDGLTSPAEVRQRVDKVNELSKSELLLPLPAQEPLPGAAAVETPVVILTATPTPEPALSPAALDVTATCEHGNSCLAPGRANETAPTATCEHGNSCLAPGRAEQPTDTLTPRPTREPPTRQPTHRPTHVPPTPQPAQDNNAGGNGNGSGNAGGNGNSNGSAGGNGNGNGNASGNGNDNGGGNAGGNGNDNGGGNAGGNGNGNGSGNGNGNGKGNGGKP